MINNQLILSKMEYMTVPDLEDYLDESGIKFQSKEKKDSLYQKAVGSIKGEEDVLRISKYVYMTSSDVMEAMEITRYRFNKLLDEGIISPYKTYRPSVYAGGRKPFGYLFIVYFIIKLMQSGKYDKFKRK